jgi:hypothetical protein
VLKLLAKFAPLDGLGIAIQDLEFRVITLAQKRISKKTRADTQVPQGQVRKPVRQFRIDVQFPVRRVGR